MHEVTLDLRGQRVAATTHEGDGPALVLLHGVGASRRTWEAVLPLLAERGRRFVALDLPGHGRSEPGRGDYSLGAFASLVRDLLDHEGLERAVVVGHSLGGGVGLQFGYQFPERCAGLVLVASGGLGREAAFVLRLATLPGSELVLPLITHPRAVGAVAWASRVSGHTPLGELRVTLEQTAETLDELHDPVVRRAFLAALRSVVDRSGQKVNASLEHFAELPVLIVWGERDAILPVDHARQTAAALQHARLVVFPGAGHEPQRHDPARFTDLVVEHADLVSRMAAAHAPAE